MSRDDNNIQHRDNGIDTNSDLTDLTQPKHGASRASTDLNEEKLNLLKRKMSRPYSYDTQYHHGPNRNVLTLFLDYLSAYISLACYHYPNVCSGLVAVAVCGLVFVLSSFMLNPVQEYGVVHNDYSNIASMYDSPIKKIDHWCLSGGDTDCDCEDPLTPISRMEYRSWTEAVLNNRKIVQRYIPQISGSSEQLPTRPAPDVAFLGGSVVEEMNGRWMGVIRSPDLRLSEKMFKNHFDKQYKNATVDGVALGVAGDTAPNVLFRLLHGEMPDSFNPKIWWLLLGMNELARMKCSEEVVIIGILRVVEEILKRKPDARIVINSLLPMVSLRGEAYPLVNDYQDSFQDTPKGTLRNRNRNKNNNAANEEIESDNSNRHTRRLAGGRTKWETGDQSQNRNGNSNDSLSHRPGDSTERTEPLSIHEQSEIVERIRVQTAERGKRMGLFRKNNREPYNPRLDSNQHKVHKFNPVSLRKHKIPFWTSIRAINKQLENFADKQKNVFFFDATPYFSENRDDGSLVLSSKLITARGHPTILGYNVFEDAIVKKVTKILKKMKLEQPDLFADDPDVVNSNDDVASHILGDPKTDDKDMYREDDMFGSFDLENFDNKFPGDATSPLDAANEVDTENDNEINVERTEGDENVGKVDENDAKEEQKKDGEEQKEVDEKEEENKEQKEVGENEEDQDEEQKEQEEEVVVREEQKEEEKEEVVDDEQKEEEEVVVNEVQKEEEKEEVVDDEQKEEEIVDEEENDSNDDDHDNADDEEDDDDDDDVDNDNDDDDDVDNEGHDNDGDNDDDDVDDDNNNEDEQADGEDRVDGEN